MIYIITLLLIYLDYFILFSQCKIWIKYCKTLYLIYD